MAAGFSTRTIAIVVVVAVVAAGFGYWGYRAHKQRETDKAIMALVTDTSVRMRDALGIATAPPTADRTRFVKKLEEHAVTSERNYQLLKRIDSRSNLVLTDAADDYLLTVREILKRQFETHRYRLLLAESSAALRNHMRADNRTGAWVQDAVKAKERVNKEYRGYNLAASALEKLLDSFAASQQKIAPYVAPALLIPDAQAADARRRLGEESRLTTAEFENLQQTAGVR